MVASSTNEFNTSAERAKKTGFPNTNHTNSILYTCTHVEMEREHQVISPRSVSFSREFRENVTACHMQKLCRNQTNGLIQIGRA